jgi:hypothetical protein
MSETLNFPSDKFYRIKFVQSCGHLNIPVLPIQLKIVINEHNPYRLTKMCLRPILHKWRSYVKKNIFLWFSKNMYEYIPVEIVSKTS